MKNLMRITLAAALCLSAAASHAKPDAGAPAEFVRRAASAAAGEQFTLASSHNSSAGWSRLLLAPTSEQDRTGGIRWTRPAWSADALRIGLRGLTMEQEPQRRHGDKKCSAYLQ